MPTALKRISALFATLSKLEWVPQLLMRLFIGYFFVETGWAKVHDLATLTQRFTEWGIPMPAFNAALSAWTELLGGALVVVGLGTRAASAALAFNMLVALVSVKLKQVDGVNAFFELDEPLYGLAFLWLAFSGPGCASVDAFIRRKVLSQGPQAVKSPSALQTTLVEKSKS